MNDLIKKIAVALGIVGVLILAGLLLWYFFFLRGAVTPTQTKTPTSTQTNGGFGGGTNASPVTIPPGQGSVPPGFAQAPGAVQKIFKIAEGPVAGATFIQTQNPTTTLARYAMADNGHVFDLGIDMPGAVAR